MAPIIEAMIIRTMITTSQKIPLFKRLRIPSKKESKSAIYGSGFFWF